MRSTIIGFKTKSAEHKLAVWNTADDLLRKKPGSSHARMWPPITGLTVHVLVPVEDVDGFENAIKDIRGREVSDITHSHTFDYKPAIRCAEYYGGILN